MIIELTLPELEETIDNYNEYCHVLCCHPSLTLCGAYKPKRCGPQIVDDNGIYTSNCAVCGKDICPDCESRIYDDCPRCE